MKKMLVLFISLFAWAGMNHVSAQKATTVVKTHFSQARLIEPSMNVYSKPLIADLVVDQSKRIKNVVPFTNAEVAALKDDVAEVRAAALFQTIDKLNCDVIVAASFDICTNDEGTGFNVTVLGYPASYQNWRTAQDSDLKWISQEIINNTSNQKKTEAIQK